MLTATPAASRVDPVNVVHLWKSDGPAGAGGAIAMKRLHRGLRDQGVRSRILCEITDGSDPDVVALPGPTRRERRMGRWAKRAGLNDVHRISSFSVPRHSEIQASDVVVVHGTHHAFFNYLALPRLSRTRPTAFVLHDMWAMTGHCAYSFDCDRWRTGCGQCPRLDTPPAITRDSTRVELALKRWVYARSRLTLISPCRAFQAQAKESILARFPVHCIPHGVDTRVYRPIAPGVARESLGISEDRLVLMFSAVNRGEWRKGGDVLQRLLRDIPDDLRARLVLLVLGQASEAVQVPESIQVCDLGYVEDEERKALAYSAADLFVSPTRGEAFGLTILEAMACGTPAVAFGVGGVLDIIEDGETGKLAELENSVDLLGGVVELLRNPQRRRDMAEKGVQRVERQFTLDRQVARYREVFDSMLAG